MAISERDEQAIEIYARHIGEAWRITDAERERLAVLLSGPWLLSVPDTRRGGRAEELKDAS